MYRILLIVLIIIGVILLAVCRQSSYLSIFSGLDESLRKWTLKENSHRMVDARLTGESVYAPYDSSKKPIFSDTKEFEDSDHLSPEKCRTAASINLKRGEISEAVTHLEASIKV